MLTPYRDGYGRADGGGSKEVTVKTQWVLGVSGEEPRVQPESQRWLLFLSPWLGSYATQSGVAWTSWITGLVALVVTATAIKPSTEEHRHHMVSPSH